MPHRIPKVPPYVPIASVVPADPVVLVKVLGDVVDVVILAYDALPLASGGVE